MRTEIIIFTPKDFGRWGMDCVIDIPGQTAKMLKGEFIGSKMITIHPNDQHPHSPIKHYLFSRN